MLDHVDFMWYMGLSEVVPRRQSGVLIQSSKNCINCLISLLQREKTYSAVSGSNKFPLPLCGNRWVDDKKVAEGALQIWPDVMVYIKETVKKPKGEVPVSYSFTQSGLLYRIV